MEQSGTRRASTLALSPSRLRRFDTGRIEPAAFFAIGFLFCLAIRFSTLNQNFWEQELVAAQTIELDWASMLGDRIAASEPPLYYALLKALGLGGASEFVLRLPSAVLDSLACGVLTWVARKTSGRVGGVAFALTFGFMPVLIRFGQEARPYPLLCFFFALAVAAATIVWRAPRLAVRAFRAGSTGQHRVVMRTAVALLVVAMVGAAWTMVIGWLAVLALQASIIVSPRLWRVPGLIRLWIVLCVATWLAIAPCVLWIAPHIDHFAATLWTPDPYATTISGLMADFRTVYGWAADGDLNRYFPGGWETSLAIGLFALAVMSAIRRHPPPPVRQVAFIAAAFPLVLFGADLFRSLVALRHIHPSLWCLCLLYADGASMIARRWPGPLALAGLAICVVLQGIDGAQAQRKTSWEPFLQFFRASHLENMNGYVTEPALAILIERSLPAGSPTPRIEIDERPAALRTALARALSADAPVWVLTSRPLRNVAADVPHGIASCAGTIGYHSFIVVARSFDLLPDEIRDCATASPTNSGG